ncbi:MAG: SDR family oxidoreductase [Solirubrobacteraceae bacterium]
MIGVTGATGGLGGRVARHLAERGVEQRLIVRDAERAPTLPFAEVAEASGYDDGDAMRRAFDGVSTLFLVSAGEHPDRVSLHRSAVAAAVAAGVERLVYTSFLAAAPDTTFTFGRDHFHTEEHIRSTGAGYTFLRDSVYLDYVPFFASAEGVIRGPASDGRVGAVARDDIAEAAVTTLLDPQHEGRAYEVTGGQAITMAEAAQILTQVTGREVVYVEETLEEARASRAPSGAPDWEIEGWVTSYAVIAAGELDVVTDTIERLTGHAPMTLAEFLQAHPESWAHLAGSTPS